MWRLGLAAACLLAACGGSDPEPGSEEDLAARIEAVPLPAGMTEVDRLYNGEGCNGCPNLIVWYQVSVPVEELKPALVGAIRTAGWVVGEGAESFGVYGARKEDHVLFVVVDATMIARNPKAPPGTAAEISVQPLDAVVQ